MTDPVKKTTVWDLPTRLTHWLIVGLFFFQWYSMEFMDDAMYYHEYGGYALMTLLLFRIVWGFIGPKYARFAEFLYGPTTIIGYSRTVFSKTSEPFASHNPLGGLSVILLLGLLLIQASTGLFMTDDILFYGPYYNAISDETQKVMSRLHHLTFDMLVALIALHIVAVMFYAWYKKQPLVSAMIHGKKPLREHQNINTHRLLLALCVLLVCIALVYGLVEYFAPETISYF